LLSKIIKISKEEIFGCVTEISPLTSREEMRLTVLQYAPLRKTFELKREEVT
jgi:hypothetical protein